MRSLESKDVVKGSELILEAQVSGSAPFTVTLCKNGKAVRNDKRHRITVKDELVALQVLGVEAGDMGLYQCTVENQVGRVSCDCRVTLKGWSRREHAWVAELVRVAAEVAKVFDRGSIKHTSLSCCSQSTFTAVLEHLAAAVGFHADLCRG